MKPRRHHRSLVLSRFGVILLLAGGVLWGCSVSSSDSAGEAGPTNAAGAGNAGASGDTGGPSGQNQGGEAGGSHRSCTYEVNVTLTCAHSTKGVTRNEVVCSQDFLMCNRMSDSVSPPQKAGGCTLQQSIVNRAVVQMTCAEFFARNGTGGEAGSAGDAGSAASAGASGDSGGAGVAGSGADGGAAGMAGSSAAAGAAGGSQ